MTAQLVYATVSALSFLVAGGTVWDLHRRPDGRPERRAVIAEAESITRAAAADPYITTEETDQ